MRPRKTPASCAGETFGSSVEEITDFLQRDVEEVRRQTHLLQFERGHMS
jgi:hypothetical protein